ncbi:hypothetical protein BU24DRAFT_361245 [Aaosphaeria arxii CBS 175.79]|uniref:Deacetylase complex subunit Sds3 n=1 Tax=Aaosphaeria arxii CBS 175.79 TaxID=1450172 RepID=A0A6A5Y5Z8_9PLEO|nr:uncharacterized protein BU24DRAFT_361245 [Aaosphaeria arxii CBS 175.79]KAF2020719.1 hypothetical protein BU24DRAFT_361245 [Aaosphaeria arxii CBS 175.79]
MARNRSPSPGDKLPLGQSATSPQPQVSKRDKRRNMLAEKMGDMAASFSDNRDSHFRAQLQALQADINLILRADPYANKPLEDNGEEARDLIKQIMGENVPTAPSAGTDYVAQVGRNYARFVDASNDAMEERDYNLVLLMKKHDSIKQEIENSYLYKMQTAEEEYKLLTATIRERLSASILQRTTKLKREKEQLDLSDSNAMLLHPNQFSINNPASPGGPQAPRKTRRTGHKTGEGEELAAENKRKRKLFEENDNDSPAPSGRNLEMGIGSPFREAKQRTVHTQFEAAAFSLERLFTEKELNLAMNQATIAAAHFFTKMKNAEPSQEASANGTNGNGQEVASENGDPADDNHDSDSPAGAPEMTRQVSSNPHATRGATRSAFNVASLANGRLPFIYNPPFVLDAKVFQKQNAQAPTPPPLVSQDIDQDMMLMMRDAPPDDALNEKLLQAAVNPVKAREYQIQPPDFQVPVSEITSHVRSSAPHLEVGMPLGGIPMSAQSSMGGYSDTGGNTPLGRFGDSSLGLGSVGMTRTASGSGRRGGRRAL